MYALAVGASPNSRLSISVSAFSPFALVGSGSAPNGEPHIMTPGPPPNPDTGYFLARPRLDAIADRLFSGMAATLIGSGGYGKSTVLLSWQRRLAQAGVTTALVTFARRDASLSAFVERLSSALHRALPDLGDSAQRVLDSGVTDPVLVARALINELFITTEEHAETLAILLDDLHAVADDVATMVFVGELLREMPPRVRFAIASRRPLTFAPIAKMRNGGKLIEVGERDLSFTADEASELVGDRKRGDDLVTQTAGWTIAVRLGASLAVERGASFDAIFAGVRDHAFDFLAQEVLSDMTVSDRDDLMSLAISPLFDEATAAILLGRNDAAATMEHLISRGVYLEKMSGGWQFHQLFRDFLLRRFRIEAPEKERAKRRRYSEYLRNKGETIEALGQLIEAGDFLEIVEYVHEAMVAIHYSDRLPALFDLLSQVPNSIKRQKPVLYRLHGRALERIGRYDAASEQFAQCYEAATALGDRRTQCMALVERGVASGTFRYQGHGSFLQSESFFREALAIAESPEFDGGQGYRRVVHYLIGIALAARCAYDDAFVHLGIAERLELAEERHSDPIFIGIALAHSWRGNWRKALEYAELAEELFRDSADFHVGFALLLQARAYYVLREDLAHATALAKDAEIRLAATRNEEERTEAIIVQGHCALALDPPNIQLALDLVDALQLSIQQRNPPIRAQYDLLRSEIAFATGDRAASSKSIELAHGIAAKIDDNGILAQVLLARARATDTGDGSIAYEQFAAARHAFQNLGDQHGATVSWIYLEACRSNIDAFGLAELDALLATIENDRLEYALDSAPEASLTVLIRALRFGTSVHRAERFLRGRKPDAVALGNVALDFQAHPEGRISALRMVAEIDPPLAARIAEALAGDSATSVAAFAQTYAGLSRGRIVELMSVDVIGSLRVRFGAMSFDERDSRWTRKKAIELLRFLVLAGTPVSRTTLLEALWPDADSGSEVTLRVTLHSLRRALEPAVDGAGNYIVSTASTIGLRTENIASSDAHRALATLARAKLLFARNAMGEARDLLEIVKIELSKMPKDRNVPRWLGPFVTTWRTSAIEVNRTLARVAIALSDVSGAIASARDAYELDPLDEETVTLLLELYARTNAFDDAKVLFRAFKRRLAEAIGTSPGPQLIALYSRVVSRGSQVSNFGLSDREREVLLLIARGRSNKEIAVHLYLSPFTINNHVARILRKLNVDNRAAAVSVASAYLESVL